MLGSFKTCHFQELELQVKLCFLYDSLYGLEKKGITTDCLVIRCKGPFHIEEVRALQKNEVARRICYFDTGIKWFIFLNFCTMFRKDSGFPIGTWFKGFVEHVPQKDWMDLCRKKFDGEFKYSEDRIGVCVEISGNRELFLHYQLINDENLFTSEILEKGTTKHYHQLPVDQQKKFRDKEDDRNRVRVITTDDNKGVIIDNVF